MQHAIDNIPDDAAVADANVVVAEDILADANAAAPEANAVAAVAAVDDASEREEEEEEEGAVAVAHVNQREFLLQNIRSAVREIASLEAVEKMMTAELEDLNVDGAAQIESLLAEFARAQTAAREASARVQHLEGEIARLRTQVETTVISAESARRQLSDARRRKDDAVTAFEKSSMEEMLLTLAETVNDAAAAD